MNEDKPAARPDITEQPTSLVEKVGTHSLGATAGVIGGAVTGALVGVAAGPVGSLPCATRGTASTQCANAAPRTTPHACVEKRNVEERAVLHGATPRRTLRTLPTTR